MLPRSAGEVLAEHVTLEVESIDRMYLNLYQPKLQHELGVVGFFKGHRGYPVVSSVLMDPISQSFVAAIHQFIQQEGVPLVHFAPGQRKDDVAHEHLARFTGTEGVLFVGRAQEKTLAYRTEKRRNPVTGASYPWLVRRSAMVNHFYVYAVDADFGPFFLKFSTYFPYNAKLCINGNEWAKRQAAKAGIAFEALDNGFLSCAEPARLQALCDTLGPEQIDALARKWLARLPHPFTTADRAAGYRYDVSVLQAEFSLTQTLDPAGRRPGLLRGGDPRQPRPWPPRPGRAGVCPAGDPPHPGPVPHSGDHRRGGRLPARGLQARQDQAVPQAGSGAADRDHHQRPP